MGKAVDIAGNRSCEGGRETRAQNGDVVLCALVERGVSPESLLQVHALTVEHFARHVVGCLASRAGAFDPAEVEIEHLSAARRLEGDLCGENVDRTRMCALPGRSLQSA